MERSSERGRGARRATSTGGRRWSRSKSKRGRIYANAIVDLVQGESWTAVLPIVADVTCLFHSLPHHPFQTPSPDQSTPSVVARLTLGGLWPPAAVGSCDADGLKPVWRRAPGPPQEPCSRLGQASRHCIRHAWWQQRSANDRSTMFPSQKAPASQPPRGRQSIRRTRAAFPSPLPKHLDVRLIQDTGNKR